MTLNMVLVFYATFTSDLLTFHILHYIYRSLKHLYQEHLLVYQLLLTGWQLKAFNLQFQKMLLLKVSC